MSSSQAPHRGYPQRGVKPRACVPKEEEEEFDFFAIDVFQRASGLVFPYAVNPPGPSSRAE